MLGGATLASETEEKGQKYPSLLYKLLVPACLEPAWGGVPSKLKKTRTELK
jgi:hypothetical protein